MNDITTIEEFHARTNWADLRKQKLALIRAIEKTTGTDEDLLEGLLHFIDAVQDLAADYYGQPAYDRSCTRKETK